MKRRFVESSVFSARMKKMRGDDLLRLIQNEILRNPECGKVVPGTGGLRKLRIPDDVRRKGKRGGLRVLYLDLPGGAITHLLKIFDKGEKVDISADEKREIGYLVKILKKEAGE